ncbi:erythroid membrane-associated protein-like [Periophthalmus magnuspinnatus]|uniref:erythroid membrane-associated protein-like n=1 Tax=Periophthalmus magnuspinnatus TaxID=409849 RepID=UPI002436F92C|nr:erythroid membrane-associated protein-like [Periophthalmus magnuspinnatus]
MTHSICVCQLWKNKWLHASPPPEGLRSHEPGLSMDQRETREDGAPPSIKAHRPAPGASGESLKSDGSKGLGVNFKRKHGPEIHQKTPPSEPGPICESLRSDRSMDPPPKFSTEPVEQQGPEVSSGQHHQTQLDSIFKLLEEDIFTFVQKELKKLHKVLSTDYPECLEPEEDEEQRQQQWLLVLCFRLDHAGAQWLTPGLRKYFCDLTLDPNTAHRKLKLSDNNKKVTHVTEEQPYPDHQDRFENWPQILCSTGLTGRCYWEVQWSGWVDISVSYRGIRRKGDSDDNLFGANDQSWSLFCSEDGFSVHHNDKHTDLPQPWSSSSGTVSVFVDCPAGSLSFYTVSSDQLTHIYTFNSTFNSTFNTPGPHTLLPGFTLLFSDSSVSLCRTDSPSSV